MMAFMHKAESHGTGLTRISLVELTFLHDLEFKWQVFKVLALYTHTYKSKLKVGLTSLRFFGGLITGSFAWRLEALPNWKAPGISEELFSLLLLEAR